ncbi:PepSY domain-containing protein [Streptomyces sp. NPDC060194]|uniref:PepSY domain-containing protein n=1 Tax=Streptomyces sp. NPDC060194 TaxID=3347069 RepID=UPI00364C9C38
MKRNLVIATVAAAALIGGGTATAVAVGSDDDAPAKKSSVQVREDAQDDGDDAKEEAAEAKDDAAQAKAAKLSVDEAIAKALAGTPGAAVSAELDSDDGNLVWDVDILGEGAEGGWTSVQVDPGDGKVLGTHKDDDSDDGAQAVRDALKGAGTTASEAAEAVAGAKDGTAVTAVELDDDGPDRVWHVETTNAAGEQQEWRVPLDATDVTAAPADQDDADDDGSDDD